MSEWLKSLEHKQTWAPIYDTADSFLSFGFTDHSTIFSRLKQILVSAGCYPEPLPLSVYEHKQNKTKTKPKQNKTKKILIH